MSKTYPHINSMVEHPMATTSTITYSYRNSTPSKTVTYWLGMDHVGTVDTTYTGHTTPDFKRKQRSHSELPIGRYARKTVDTVITPGLYTGQGGSNNNETFVLQQTGNLFRVLPAASTLIGEMKNSTTQLDSEFAIRVAKLSALRKVNRPGYAAAEDVVFARDTFRLLTKPLQSLQAIVKKHNLKVKNIKSSVGKKVRNTRVGITRVERDIMLNRGAEQRILSVKDRKNWDTKKLKLERAQLHKIREIRTKLVTKRGKLAQQLSALGVTLTDTLTELWLRFRFEFCQVVYTTHGVAEALAKRTIEQESSDIHPVLTARGEGQARGDREFKARYRSGDLSWTVSQSSKTHLLVRAGIRYRYKLMPDISHVLGGRLTDMAAAMWALKPMSWLIDRLVNITAMLDAIQAFNGHEIQIISAWTSSIEESEEISSLDDMQYRLPTSGSIFASGSGGGTVITKKSKGFTRLEWEPRFSDIIPPIHDRTTGDLPKMIDAFSVLIRKVAKVKPSRVSYV